MAKKTYSIRKGFEYQDLYCGIQILQSLISSALESTFQIESDDVLHLDDLVLTTPDQPTRGHQVKFHVTSVEFDTFDSFVEKQKKRKAKSLLEKLYHGWALRSSNGELPFEGAFISSRHAEPGAGNLGDAILSETQQISDDFFDHAKFAAACSQWESHLQIDRDALRCFLAHMTFRFGYESIVTLRSELGDLLGKLGFPHDRDAVGVFLEIIGNFATNVRGDTTMIGLLQDLWQHQVFRDATERILPSGSIPGKARQRATKVRIMAVSIDALPAIANERVVYSEEPIAFQRETPGFTDRHFSGMFDDIRKMWSDQWTAWHRHRVTSILNAVSHLQPDIVLFPRFSLPYEVALDVADWANRVGCNVALGSHSLPQATVDTETYYSSLGSQPPIDARIPTSANLVVDTFIRPHRRGRSCVSEIDSPYQKTEQCHGQVSTFDIECAAGWISVAVIPSASALATYTQAHSSKPDLLLSACGIHADIFLERVFALNTFKDVPFVICAADLASARVGFVEAHAHAAAAKHSWEGVTIVDIDLTPSRARMSDHPIAPLRYIPVCYSSSPTADTVDIQDTLSGYPTSVTDASLAFARAANHKPSNDEVIILSCQDMSTILYNRCEQAEQKARAALPLSSTTPQQVSLLAKQLQAVVDFKGQLQSTITLAHAAATSIPSQRPDRRNRANVIDRSIERRNISRFMDSTTTERILHLFGLSGIGKLTLIRDVQRTSTFASNWLYFRCPDDAAFAEALGQLMTALGAQVTEVPTLSRETYDALCTQLASSGFRCIVLSDAQNLPISATKTDHGALNEMLSTLCSTQQKIPRIILLSDVKGQVAFSGSHLLKAIHMDGLASADTVQLFQELLVDRPLQFPPPEARDLEQLAEHVHGHPLLVEIVASLIEETPIEELLERLHTFERYRAFVFERLLGEATLSSAQIAFLCMASILRIPLPVGVFEPVTGAQTRAIVDHLVDRCLITVSETGLSLHSVLKTYFRSTISPAEEARFHKVAFDFFESRYQAGDRSVGNQAERLYHAMVAGESVDLRDMQLFAGSLRSAMLEAVRDREWVKVQAIATSLLSIFKRDPVARLGMAVALDAQGDQVASRQYFDALADVDRERLFLAVALLRSKIRRKEFDEADWLLGQLKQRFPKELRIDAVNAQLLDARGASERALEVCEMVLSSERCHEKDAFTVGLLLRNMKKLDKLVTYVDVQKEGAIRNEGLRRLYAYACVTTDYDPNGGMRILLDLWKANGRDGFVVADFGSALVHLGKHENARVVFEKALIRTDLAHRERVIEAFAEFWNSQMRFTDAHSRFRELLQYRQWDPHVYRRFASSLIEAASDAAQSHNRGVEDACKKEAEAVLGKLLNIAPEDRWAADALDYVKKGQRE